MTAIASTHVKTMITCPLLHVGQVAIDLVLILRELRVVDSPSDQIRRAAWACGLTSFRTSRSPLSPNPTDAYGTIQPHAFGSARKTAIP